MALRKVTLSLSKLPNWLDAIWLCALALYALAGAAIVPFHGDESTQIFMGRDYYYLFLEGDLSKIHYVSTGSESPIEQHLRTVNGTISKTIHGWLAARNGFEAADINGPWEWDYEYDANRAAGGIPDAELLRQARLASSAQLAVAVAVFFAFVRLSINRPDGVPGERHFRLSSHGADQWAARDDGRQPFAGHDVGAAGGGMAAARAQMVAVSAAGGKFRFRHCGQASQRLRGDAGFPGLCQPGLSTN